MTTIRSLLSLSTFLSLSLATPLFAEQYPSDKLDLSLWKLTLPFDTDRPGKPDEIQQPDLRTFRDSRFFDILDGGQGIVFRAPCGGTTTKGSNYPRSELREMQGDGTKLASWGTADGKRHSLTARLAITKTPAHKPHVICAQIHGEDDKLLAIRLEGLKLIVERDSQKDVTIQKNYVLGTPFTIKIVAGNGSIQVLHDERPVVEWKDRRTGCYFKVGCYTQSNVESGDSAESVGAVVVYDLMVSHEG